jgi:hypothetical protein
MVEAMVRAASATAFTGKLRRLAPTPFGFSKAAINGAMGAGNPDIENGELDSKQLAVVYLYLTALQPWAARSAANRRRGI